MEIADDKLSTDDVSSLLSRQFDTSMRLEESRASERNFKLLCKQDICEAHVPVIVQKLNRLQFGIDINLRCQDGTSVSNYMTVVFTVRVKIYR